MGGGLSTPDTVQVLQSFGSLPLLTTLAEPTHIDNLDYHEDPTVESSESLLNLPPHDVYESIHLLCSRVGMLPSFFSPNVFKNLRKVSFLMLTRFFFPFSHFFGI
jgi:hypothetical protein